ncbi:3-deoxy-D-manno-octulosonic acid transferase [Aestuariibius sp. 2305UL40-4]|uniref:3-deoxy-D-manno-octulosonic acid transferase n=1 Tax=Aestuariibius violaceus TaxID=3234132 RepID=UPI00398F00C0
MRGAADRGQRAYAVLHRPSAPPAGRGNRGVVDRGAEPVAPRPRSPSGRPASALRLYEALHPGRRLFGTEPPRPFRPDGPLIWIHPGVSTCSAGLLTFAKRLQEAEPDVAVLMTGAVEPRADVPVLFEYAPEDTVVSADRFLDHWRPDALIWGGGRVAPSIVSRAVIRSIPKFLIEADADQLAVDERGWIPGLARATLRGFDRVFALQEDDARRLRQIGVPAERVETAGRLERGVPALPHQPSEHSAVNMILAGRPVWLGAGVPQRETTLFLEAHKAAFAHTHRLLLVIVPDHPESGAAFEEEARRAGFTTGLRSRGDDPEAGMQVYVADLEGELGLWMRVAPITAMGGSFLGRTSISPMEPAALGSAVIAGPKARAQHPEYDRMAVLGALRALLDPQQLGRAVQTLLAPDAAASLAAAAWKMSSEGAEATDRLISDVLEAIGQ